MPKKWKCPPEPRPRAGGGNGLSASGRTNTALGDLVEAAIAKALGWKHLVAGTRVGPFDLETPDGVLCEVKACSVYASEYKAKPKAREVLAKVEAAAKLGKDTATVIAVVEDDEAWIYRRAGLGCFRLAADGEGRGWVFEGVVKL
jgi:hypothetical protein